MSVSMPDLYDVYTAQRRIDSMVRPTALIADTSLAKRCGAASVHLKLECLQNTGAFKVRGASNKILSLSDEQKRRGVITFSTGNHGKAVAFVAAQQNIRAVVCLSEHVPAYRADMIRSFGAELVIHGASQDEAEHHYVELVAQKGFTPVEPFDDPLIIAGQGTIALEILSELPETEVLLVQLSGGGLLGGIAMAAKSINPRIHIVGVSIDRSPAMLESVKAGKPVAVEEKDTLADSLLGGIGLNNRYTLPLVERYVDEHVCVSEQQIIEGMVHVFERQRLIAEGAAAVGVGALLGGLFDAGGKRVVTLLSGSTVASKTYLETVLEGLV
ncbi:MAG: pyridoxal-phosphate dependent enzyme [Desulfopila sp.]|nr:pyridoxal-phosphate dependent enzyme [Desulfopila sp.]